MVISRFTLKKNVIVAEVFGNGGMAYFWQERFLPRWLPLLLGLVLGIASAVLITNEAWHFLIPLALVVPAAILFIRYPFVAVMLWVLVTPYFVRTPSTEGRYIFWIVHRAMIPATLGIVILSDWLGARKREPVRFGRAELAMFLFLLWALINTFLFNQDPVTEIIRFYDRVFVPFCMYWLVRLTAPEEKDFKRLLWVVFPTAVAQSIIGLLSWFAPQVLPPQWLGLERARTVGTFGNPAVYTTTLVFCSLLLFQYAMNCKSRWVRFVFLITIGLAFSCVFFSFSRGSWLGGGVVLLGLMFIYPKAVIRLSVVLIASMYILGSSVLAAQMAHAWERLNTERTAEDRIVQNYASMRMIETKPLFGWGWGNYDRYDHQFYARVGDSIAVRNDQTSHNTYLSIVVEMGLMGFLIYIFPVGWWLMLSIRVWRRLPRDGFGSRQLLIALWLLILDQFIVSSFMDMIRFHAFGTTIFWMAMGLIGNMVYVHLKPDDIGTPNWAYQPNGRV